MIQLRVQQIVNSFQSLFSIRLESFVAFAVIAYFSGWHYVNAYFSYFNVNRSSFSFDDYTIFLYSFFVIVELHRILLSSTLDAWIGIAMFLAMIVISSIAPRKSVHAVIGLVQRMTIVGLGVGCLFLFSGEAGRIDAQQVAYGNQARRVSVILTKEFTADLKKYHDEEFANDWIKKMKNWDRLGALGLIWRNGDETMFQVYETQGRRAGCPAETYRIPNRFIVLLKSVEPNESPLVHANSGGAKKPKDCLPEE